MTSIHSAGSIAGSSTALRGGPVQPSRSALMPLGPDEIRLTGGYWGGVQALNTTAVIGHCEHWVERIGWAGNLDRTAAGEPAHVGLPFADSEVYKLLEAMAWELGARPDDALAARYEALVARVAAAQDADGYLDTAFGGPGQRPRYSDLEEGHELYCFGHLFQAAVARLRSGADDLLPAIARRLADHVWDEFGPDGRDVVCGHPEVETALVELGRATGEPRYIELARLFVERRGTGTLRPIPHGAAYFQDDMPIRDAAILRGHAVRALYLSSGAIDVATETADGGLGAAVRGQYAATLARRTYITGGMGAHHQDEAYGDDFELPADRAYAETCAAIASVQVAWRLQLETGDERYADVIERTLLNAVLVALRADGRGFFYSNTLHQRTRGEVPVEDEVNARAESSLRAPWFEVSCCPTNLARTLASVQMLFATRTADAVQLHQFGDYSIDTTLEQGRFALDVRSGYPFDGRVTVRIGAAPDTPVALRMRVPAWAEGAMLVDGDSAVAPAGGSVGVERVFAVGDELVLDLPFDVRTSTPDGRIDAVRGQIAVERGPLVLCLESADLPDGQDVQAVRAVGAVRWDGARAVVDLRLESPAADDWPYGDRRPPVDDESVTVPLIPYSTWANRGPSTMRVFLPAAR